MTHQEIRERFLKFFEDRGHKIVPSSSLLPDDPSVLFTTAGVQQFKSYYTGQADPMKDFGSLNVISIQKSFRTGDIDEVGDISHNTFFEMLGYFSFGGYFKKETIQWTYDFIVNVLGFSKERLRPTVFAGDDQAPFDEESFEVWKSLGFTNEQIGRGNRNDNFWGPVGVEGPCGPANELYIDGIEIGTLVFNEYFSDKDKKLQPLKTKGVDVGLGFERILIFSQKVKSIYETDIFTPIMKQVPEDIDIRVRRIIADHARSISFLISDGVLPSNKDQGYVLRRLIRRVIVHQKLNGKKIDLFKIFQAVVENYKPFYFELNDKKIADVVMGEASKFTLTLDRGLSELNKLPHIDASIAFKLYESYGLPYEILKELGVEKAKGLNREDFEEEFKKHQEKSRAGAEKKFGGHGLILDTGELKAANEEELKVVTRLHTATHLLHAALRKILGEEVHQAGSDITAERLRFDFTFPRKLTQEETKKVEELVSQVIKDDLKVTKEEMPYEEAIKTGALSFFKLKYPSRVYVYSVGNFSKELCGGPHVTHTGEIGKFKIVKEEAVSAGVRRIRAVVE